MSTTNIDQVASDILAGGRACDPVRWYDDQLQPLIDTARRVNRGEADVSVLQGQLDSIYGDGAIVATDVTFPGEIDPVFAVVTGESLAAAVEFNIDMAGLTPDHVVWTSSEGHRINAVTPEVDAIEAPAPGTYTVTVDINYAGAHWTHTETYNVPDGYEPGGPLDPHIDNLSPATGVAGVEVTVQVFGFNFDETSIVEIDQAESPTEYVSPTELTTTFTPAAGEVDYVLGFSVRNGNDEESNTVTFSVTVPEFDPGDATIEAVKEHVVGLGDPDDETVIAAVQRILDMERAGKNRSTLVEWLDARLGVV